MAAKEKSELNGVLGWVDERFPLLETFCFGRIHYA